MSDPRDADRFTPLPSAPREIWSARDKSALSFGATIAVLGVGLLALFSEHLSRPWSRPPLFAGVLLASIGPVIALTYLLAPSRASISLRPAVIGVAAAWLTIELAGAARRLGIAADSGWFRVLWAPVVEECCKALFLAAILTPSDRDRSRNALVTYGVLVGAGFAFRENVVYFATALDGTPLTFQWLLLRAIPPACAHMFFGATYATIFAQAVIHERALERPAPSWSVVALVLSVLAHVTYNGVPWMIGAAVPDAIYPFVGGWSLVALVATLGLRLRVLNMSFDDPDPPAESLPIVTRSNLVVTCVSLALLALWLVPLAIPRYLAVVLAPFAIGCLLTALLERTTRFTPYLLWLLWGIAARPFFSMGEAALSALPAWSSRPMALFAASWAGSALWCFASVFAGRWVSRHHSRSLVPLAVAAMTGGMLAANIGGNLAAGSHFAPWRELVSNLLRFFPRTVTLATGIALLSVRRLSLGLVAAAIAPVLVVLLDKLLLRFRLPAAICVASVFLPLFVALLWSERPRKFVMTEPEPLGDDRAV
jgi:RsiW-degrading membrane proteinase PrsW (M82 family)